MMPRWPMVLSMVALAGCTARHVVVEPERVDALGDSEWTIRSAPSENQEPESEP